MDVLDERLIRFAMGLQKIGTPSLRNHAGSQFQLTSASVCQGLVSLFRRYRVLTPQSDHFPLNCYRPYSSVSSTVRHCDGTLFRTTLRSSAGLA